MNIKQRRLPSAYQECEWIRSDGNQYIDTGYAFTDIKLKIETKYRKEVYASSNPFGVDNGSAPRGMHGNIYSMSGYLGNSSIINSDTFANLNVDHTVTFEIFDNSVKWNHDGIDYAYNGLNGWDGTTLTDGLFCTHGDTGYYYKMIGRIYYHRMYDSNGVKVRDFIPCYRISDNEVGMYDIVGDTFYTNQGTGAFTKGDDVVTVDSIAIPQGNVAVIRSGSIKLWQRLPSIYQEVEWIASDGSSYIDTEYVFSNPILKIEQKYRKTSVLSRNTFGVDTASTIRQMHGNIWGGGFYIGNSLVLYGDELLDNDNIITFETFENSAMWIINGKEKPYNGLNGWNGATISDYLFATHRGSGNDATHIMIGRIYYHRMYDNNGIKVRDFVPCYRISDGVIGMYDLIERKFYNNKGTGTFTKGNDL